MIEDTGLLFFWRCSIPINAPAARFSLACAGGPVSQQRNPFPFLESPVLESSATFFFGKPIFRKWNAPINLRLVPSLDAAIRQLLEHPDFAAFSVVLPNFDSALRRNGTSRENGLCAPSITKWSNFQDVLHFTSAKHRKTRSNHLFVKLLIACQIVKFCFANNKGSSQSFFKFLPYCFVLFDTWLTEIKLENEPSKHTRNHKT